jgi:cell division protein FtsA
MFSLVKQDIEKAGLSRSLNGGIVLVGGGCLMPGMVEVAEQAFELPVRQGSPRGIGGLTDVVAAPTFATAVGLAAWGLRHVGPSVSKVEQESFSIGRLGGRVAGFFSDLFTPVASAVSGRRAGR